MENPKSIDMKKRIIFIPTGAAFTNRKEAKIVMGHGRFNRALKNGEILFVYD